MARKTEKADALDKHIGNRIREQRENLGMTQSDLARLAGVSYQQIHKYEHGANRISAGRLGLIAEILKIPVQVFYDGFGNFQESGTAVSAADASDSRRCLELARHFRQIDNPRHKEALHLLVRVLAS
jgi:transcriptional regulator with XRE-family HTH domain